MVPYLLLWHPTCCGCTLPSVVVPYWTVEWPTLRAEASLSSGPAEKPTFLLPDMLDFCTTVTSAGGFSLRITNTPHEGKGMIVGGTPRQSQRHHKRACTEGTEVRQPSGQAAEGSGRTLSAALLLSLFPWSSQPYSPPSPTTCLPANQPHCLLSFNQLYYPSLTPCSPTPSLTCWPTC